MMTVVINFTFMHCPGAVAITRGSGVFEDAGQIWLDNVQCNGSEGRLIDCAANEPGVNNCNHQQDAGVRCCKFSLYHTNLMGLASYIFIQHNIIKTD